MEEWGEIGQSIFIGLIFSFLAAKLISTVSSSPEEYLRVVREDELPVVVDDDWKWVESREFDEMFGGSAATAYHLSQKIMKEVQLLLYGLFKIATRGPCLVPQPSKIKISAWVKCCMLDVEDAGIDAVDVEDELEEVDYIEDIYNFYRPVETNNRVPDYMDSQAEINKKNRSIVVDWLIDGHCQFELMPETLYLAIHIFDRYLSMDTELRTRLCLLGLTAMVIANKYEEEDRFKVKNFILATNMVYKREDILSMEKSILDKLDWSLNFPTQYVFLVWFLRAAAFDKEMENMVFFYAELALMQYSMIMYYPSMVAASAMYAAHCTLKKSPAWSKTLEHHTGFSERQLVDCGKMLVKLHSLAGEGELNAVYRKYSCPQRGAVALRPPADKLLLEES